MDLVGGPGSGRSRCLAEIADALVRDGRRVVRLPAGSRPFASLEPLLGSIGVPSTCSLRELQSQIENHLRVALGEGAVILADDANGLDRWTSAALERCLRAGSVVFAIPVAPRARKRRAHGEIVHLAPLDEAALEPLFCGPERFFHLRTDAARALWARTGGVPLAVAEEVEAWVRAGIARWYEDRLFVDREALDRLGAGLRLGAPPPAAGREGGGLEPHLEELLAWLWLAWPNTHAKLVAEAMGEALWFVEACIDELLRRGAVRRFLGDRIEPRAAPSVAWPPERRRLAHRTLARRLAPGAEGRLLHLVSAREGAAPGEDAEIAVEACTLAEQRACRGLLGGAVAALHEGAATLRHGPAPFDENALVAQEALFSLWAEIAALEGTPHALDRALYEICRVHPRTAALEHIEALVRAAIALHAGSDRALAAADAVPPFASPRLERTRQGIRVIAARHVSRERLEGVLAEIAEWAKTCASPPVRSALAGWMGRLRYQQGCFREAAELHARAALGEPWAPQRILAMLQSASARMEAFRLGEAAEQAREAHAAAVLCRHAHHEARATWLLRTIAYRRGEVLRPDPELGDAAARLGVPDLEAMICLCEAAICFRADDEAAAADLAGRAYRLWTSMGKRWAAPLARCLAIASGDFADDEVIQSLADAARTCPVSGLGVQMLGLLAMARPDLAADWAAEARGLCAGIPRARWRQRLDVLSVEEALRALGIRDWRGLRRGRSSLRS